MNVVYRAYIFLYSMPTLLGLPDRRGKCVVRFQLQVCLLLLTPSRDTLVIQKKKIGSKSPPTPPTVARIAGLDSHARLPGGGDISLSNGRQTGTERDQTNSCTIKSGRLQRVKSRGMACVQNVNRK